MINILYTHIAINHKVLFSSIVNKFEQSILGNNYHKKHHNIVHDYIENT